MTDCSGVSLYGARALVLICRAEEWGKLPIDSIEPEGKHAAEWGKLAIEDIDPDFSLYKPRKLDWSYGTNLGLQTWW